MDPVDENTDYAFGQETGEALSNLITKLKKTYLSDESEVTIPTSGESVTSAGKRVANTGHVSGASGLPTDGYLLDISKEKNHQQAMQTNEDVAEAKRILSRFCNKGGSEHSRTTMQSRRSDGGYQPPVLTKKKTTKHSQKVEAPPPPSHSPPRQREPTTTYRTKSNPLEPEAQRPTRAEQTDTETDASATAENTADIKYKASTATHNSTFDKQDAGGTCADNTYDFTNAISHGDTRSGLTGITSMVTIEPSVEGEIDVEAPDDLPGGYNFEAEISGHRYHATVPSGGVKKGGIITVRVCDRSWRNGIFNLCPYGCRKPLLFWNSFCCPLVVLPQILNHVNFDFPNSTRTHRSSKVRLVWAVLMFWLFMNALLLGVCYLKMSNEYTLTYADLAGVIMVNVFYFCLIVYVTAATRGNFKKKFAITEDKICCCGTDLCLDEHCGSCKDCCVSTFCLPCTLFQMADHLDHYDERR